MVEQERMKNGRYSRTGMVIVDAQSVNNTDTAHLKGYDAGKKVSGIKRHIAVDSQGLPHAVHVTHAGVNDRLGTVDNVEKHRDCLQSVKKVIGDGGYTGERFATAINQLIDARVAVIKRDAVSSFKVVPKRWVVERSFAWLEKSRRMYKNCERLVVSSLGMIKLAFIRILLNRS